MTLLAQVAQQNGCEVGIAAGGDHSEAVADRPKHKAGDPLLEAEPDCARDAFRRVLQLADVEAWANGWTASCARDR